MTSTALEEFGYAVRKARLDLGWNMERLAAEALGNGARKGYVGQVEKGTRNLSPETIDKFDQALSLPEDVVKAVHMAPKVEAPSPEETKLDETAERLLTQVAKDETVAPVAEALLTTLAYEFAGGQFRDIHTAYTSLRQALQAAEDIRKRGEMPPDNTGSQLNAVMAEVSKLNDLGALEDADALLDAEEKRMQDYHKGEKDRLDQQAKALLDRRMDQDRLRNLPDQAAKRLVSDLHRQAPAGGVFLATNRLASSWKVAGAKSGDIFALQVALELAKINYARSKTKKPLVVGAIFTLGRCHFELAERSTKDGHLKAAKNAFMAALDVTKKVNNPLSWSAAQDGLGLCLMAMGERASDPNLLENAVFAHRKALAVDIAEKSDQLKDGWNNLGIALQKLGEITQSIDTLAEAEETITIALTFEDKSIDPHSWETTQNNLGLAQRWRGDLMNDLTKLDQARASYAACEALNLKKAAPFVWAQLQWNIADLAFARFKLDPAPLHLVEARTYLANARDFFVDGSDYQTQRCDELLAEINAAAAA